MSGELAKYSYYYDRKSAGNSDYRSYMEKKAAVSDISAAIKQSSDRQITANAVMGGLLANRMAESTNRIQQSLVQVKTGIQSSINAQTYMLVASQAVLQRTFQAGFDKVNNTLDMGFAGVSSQLGAMTAAFTTGLARVSDDIKDMSKAICDRLDAIHDIVNNPLLTQSRELYRRASLNYSKGLYEEALEDIKAAVEKSKTDYISWVLLGKVYLFGASEFGDVIDLDAAIEAFTTAAKYVKPDIAENEDAKLMAAEIWFYLGLAKQTKSNDLLFAKNTDAAAGLLAEAQEAFERSYSYSDNMLESLYNIARCNVLLGKNEEALQNLETAIVKDRNYCLKIANDSDFDPIVEDVYALIDRLKKAIYGTAKEQFGVVRELADDTVFIGGPFADMVKALVDGYLTEQFTEDMPYFDVRDGYEQFPVIRQYLEMKEYPCDRLVAEAYSKDFGYGAHFERLRIKVRSNDSCTAIIDTIYNNSIILKSTDYSSEYNLYTLTYKYSDPFTTGEILKTRINKENIGGAPLTQDMFADAAQDLLRDESGKLRDMFLAGNVIKLKGCGKQNKWEIGIKYNPQDKDNKHAVGLVYKPDNSVFIPLTYAKSHDVAPVHNIFMIYFPIPAFLDDNTLLFYPYNDLEESVPIRVFQVGIISKKAKKAKEAMAKKAVEAVQKRKAEEDIIKEEIQGKIAEYRYMCQAGRVFTEKEKDILHDQQSYFNVLYDKERDQHMLETYVKKFNMPDIRSRWEPILERNTGLLKEIKEASYQAYHKAFSYILKVDKMAKFRTFVCILIGTIGGIHFHNFILPIISLVVGLIIMLKYGYDTITNEFLGPPLVLGISSIIAGVGVHNFIVGLVGVIGAIVWFGINMSKANKPYKKSWIIKYLRGSE